MEMKDVKKKRLKTYPTSFRIPKTQKIFMKKNDISLRKLIDKALRELGYKGD